MSKTYIEFTLLQRKPKTEVYTVNNKSSGVLLGIIKWFAPWRQYCFFPSETTVYSQGCLKDIENFIQKLMHKRKEVSIKE